MAQKIYLPGQAVSLKSRAGLSPVTPVHFQVISKLSDRGGRSLYRIRSDKHDHERVELGSNLAAQEQPGES